MWGLARAAGARVLLRIEDHDAQRASRAYEAALLDDLEWLGFDADDHSIAEFRAGRSLSRQSDRHDIYASIARGLIDRGLVYACNCSRQTLRATSTVNDAELRYPGTCRNRGMALGDDVSWRLRLEPARISFIDLLCGPQEQQPSEQCGDVVIRDRLGNWTYQFVASVDDHLQQIDLIIRGRDLLASTGRQIQMAALLGRPTPAAFAHHPLIMKSATQKLSKSDGDSGVRDLRAKGWTPARVIGHAARLARLVDDDRDVAARDVRALFTDRDLLRSASGGS